MQLLVTRFAPVSLTDTIRRNASDSSFDCDRILRIFGIKVCTLREQTVNLIRLESSVLAVNFRCLVGRRSLRSLSPSGGGFAGVRVKWGHRTDTAEVQLPRALVAL